MSGSRKISAFIVAGTHSGSGKTTVTLGIMDALRRSGLVVQSFKSGPDYIDPAHHTMLLGRPSYNLDTWMMGVKGVKKTFRSRINGADVAVVEGVMGLYDGKDGRSDIGSTAHLAKTLKLPVLLVVDAASMARSVGAVVAGFKNFDKGIDLRWVVFNRVGSARHLKMLTDAMPRSLGVTVLGCLPKDERLKMPERHLGLVMPKDVKGSAWKVFLTALSTHVGSCIEIKKLITDRRVIALTPPAVSKAPRCRIGVALDRAFNFYYKENLDVLAGLGAELVYFSPITSRNLPDGISGLYIGGGYPELNAAKLEANRSMRESIKAFCASGRPVIAECGGLMYLASILKQTDGKGFAMSGVFPFSVEMQGKRAALGYREVECTGVPFVKDGVKIRGHEFRYSKISTSSKGIKKCFKVCNGAIGAEGYIYKSTLATYMHLHFASSPAFARGFVRRCMEAG